MSRCIFPLLLLSLLAVGNSEVVAQQGPAKGIPELEVLSHYVGRWDAQVTSEGPLAKGQVGAGWVLDGKFVQQSGRLSSDDGSIRLTMTTMMTYDPGNKVYRTWTFLSSGSVATAEGTWDADKKTMTSIQRNGNNTTKTVADFSEDGVEKWTITTTDQDDKVVSQLQGINKRRQQ